MGILLLVVYLFFGWFFYSGFTAESAERSIPRPAYEYGKSDAYDKANADNAHYQESRPADSYNRSTEERTRLERSSEAKRQREQQLKKEERNSYKQQ